MNKDNAHLYLPLVQALAKGKTIQRNAGKSVVSPIKDVWVDEDCIPTDINVEYYRVKPEPRKARYRVAEMKSKIDGEIKAWTVTADHLYEENEFSLGEDFVRWLTDRIEYEITENSIA